MSVRGYTGLLTHFEDVLGQEASTAWLVGTVLAQGKQPPGKETHFGTRDGKY